jgi:tRNA threonylcarbamoyladenosine biosynthesis protein TsaE
MKKIITNYYLKNRKEAIMFASVIGKNLHRGDVVLLKGTLGAGKTSFAQAMVQAYADEEISVTSPTFTLVQIYEVKHKAPVWHCDLYRLEHESEVEELGLEDAFDQAVTLIEWPEILLNYVPERAVQLTLQHPPRHAKTEEERHVQISYYNNHTPCFIKDLQQWQQQENPLSHIS